MKHRLVISVILCLLITRLSAQSPLVAIDSLVKFRVITAKERPVIIKEAKDMQKREGASYRVAALGGLQYIMLKKVFHVDPHTTGLFYGYSKVPLKQQNRDSINKSMRLLLSKIKRAGLLTDKVYNNAQRDIDSGRYLADLQLIGGLTEMSWRMAQLAPDKLLPVAEELHKNGIVSDLAFVRLIGDINNGNIESSFQLNDYCKLNRVLDLEKYPSDPHIWLQQLHHDIASILPGLNFTDFSYTTVPDTSFSLPGLRFKVSLTINGRTYKHSTLATNNHKSKGDEITSTDFLVQDFYRIFNKALTDQQSPYRLHGVTFVRADNDEHRRKSAVMALTREQWDVFMKAPCLNYMLISLDAYDNTLTSAKLDSMITGWTRLGLFAHLSGEQLGKAIDDAQASNPVSPSYLLTNFPNVIYDLHDAITGSRLSYKIVLQQLAKITHGAFNPVKITQLKTNKGIKLQYLFKGKTHSYTFPTPYAWLDGKFPAFVQNLGKENVLPGNFYQLRYYDSVIYLTEQQHDDAIKYNLLEMGPTVEVRVE